MCKPIKKSEIIVESVDEENIIFDIVNEDVKILNSTAYKIFLLCDGNNTITDIINSIINDISVPLSEDDKVEIKNDIIECIDKLKNMELLI